MKNKPVNVGNTERLVAAGLAGVMLIRFIRRPGLLGLFALGSLIYRATTGHCYGYQWAGLDTCSITKRRRWL